MTTKETQIQYYTACTVCDIDTFNFMHFVFEAFTADLCPDCWHEFIDKTSVEGLLAVQALMGDERRRV